MTWNIHTYPVGLDKKNYVYVGKVIKTKNSVAYRMWLSDYKDELMQDLYQ